MAPNIVGPNYRNVTVHTEVNISNSKPEVLNVSVYESQNASLINITITAGYTKKVYCNATVRDWNGFNDVYYINATLWHIATSEFNGSDDNNSHYTNLSCTINESLSTYTGWFVCAFDVWYYANNGTWMCNVSAMDYYDAFGYNNQSTTFYPVYALNVTEGINYGNVAVEEYSGNVTANVTNLGNVPINVTVHGYGTQYNDGLAMNCSIWGNISIESERFSANDVDWASKIPLAVSAQQIPGLTLSKQVDDNPIVNTTYWQLYINSTNVPGGNCTGYVVFTAIAP